MKPLVFRLLPVLVPLAMPLRADVRLPAVFGDHMVLQAGDSTPVWGWAAPGEAVTVTAGQATASTTAGADGKWRVNLTALAAALTPRTLTVTGSNTLVVRDVLVGDVWLCSGQSNMALPLRRVLGRKTDDPQGLGQANCPALRLFQMTRTCLLDPQDDCQGSWSVCTPDTAREFSAVGYFFGRELHDSEHVAIGLLGANRGSTNAEYWTSLAALDSDPLLKAYADTARAAKIDFPQLRAQYLHATHEWQLAKSRWPELEKQWQAAADAARATGTTPPPPPAAPGEAPPRPAGMDPWDDNFMALPTVLFNAMIHPLIPFGIKGVIWYQGEGNAAAASLYQPLVTAMVRDWRQRWGRGEFPFLFVQLANYQAPAVEPDDGSDWPALREAQLRTLQSLPNSGMAVAIDIGAANDIHPLNKREVGRRLALIARAKTYGHQLEFSGPLYQKMEITGGKLRLHFTHTAGQLVARDGPLKRFAIAGNDRKFVWAAAVIDGESVVVSSPAVPAPVAVRYAWSINPEGCNLYNAAGLPASPFRTDDWPAGP